MQRGNFAMRPRERRETSEQELFRSRLDQIIDMKHALVKLGQAIDWRFLEERFGAVYTDKLGQPPLPTRLMAGLAILKRPARLRRNGPNGIADEGPFVSRRRG
jgi:IS5 family transposase